MLLLEPGLSCEKETLVIIQLDNEAKAKYNSKLNELLCLAKLPLDARNESKLQLMGFVPDCCIKCAAEFDSAKQLNV